MSYKYVIAIVRLDSVAPLEKRLTQLGVGGITVSRVKGFGEYKNFFSDDWLTEHAKLEIFADEGHVAALLAALRTSDGVAAVMPVEVFQHLRAGSDVAPDASS